MRRQLVHAVDAAPVSAQIAAGVAEQLPVDDHSVDIVVCFLVLCSVRDVPRALSEIRRVLRPGGRLVLAEHVRGTGLRALAQSAISPLNRHFAGGCRSDRRTVEALDIAGFEIMALEEIAGPGRFSPTAPVVACTATPRLTGQLPATGHEAPGTMLR
ncbi:SAM-dependent methyltransferase [Rhodococcus sp. ABRD24]|uniref:class I SAM-dependent methyltransferase n=1 Tax=Rhodococcus sp. ABRD24 TaxID=2507582 RepID=UPI0010402135|nr:class I SAM-dependent methyltransferase [Rhodococcus sp. ABRD24]QBJ97381.1 SAM-dependent methyltransferase [Rhodococcus sp. ABRD24]